MNYSWNVKKIKRDLALAKLFHAKRTIKYYNYLLKGIDINQDSFDKKEILLFDKTDELNFDEARDLFLTGLDYIPDELYESFLDIFSWFENIKSLEMPSEYSKIDLTNDELITLAHDIFKSMDNKEVMDAFNVLINKHNNLLNIQEATNNKTVTKCVGGITYYHPLRRKSHVNIFREHTIEDIEYTVHESMHFIYKYLLHRYYRRESIHLFDELEGEYANIYVARYLEDNGFKDASTLRKSLVNNVLTASYLLMVNHVLFKTSKNKEFDCAAATKELNSKLQTVKIDILPEELTSYLTISGYEELTDILSYLTALELFYDYEPSDALEKIGSLKVNDSEVLLENLACENIHFHENGYKDFIKEYKITHKI